MSREKQPSRWRHHVGLLIAGALLVGVVAIFDFASVPACGEICLPLTGLFTAIAGVWWLVHAVVSSLAVRVVPATGHVYVLHAALLPLEVLTAYLVNRVV